MSIESLASDASPRGTPPYLWSDLLARRDALGLQRRQLAQVLGADDRQYQARERGSLPALAEHVDEIAAMEAFVDDQTTALLRRVPIAGTVVLRAVEDQREFERRFPGARSSSAGSPYPLTLQHVAAGRASAILRRRDRTVEVRRGDRSADLAVRRLAVGVSKREAAGLLGVSDSHYYQCERGTESAPTRLVEELQAIDDFIQLSGLLLTHSRFAGAAVVHMLDDHEQFIRAFPRAVSVRSCQPYPLRVHRIAVARRAQRLAAEGRPTRIAVVSRGP